MTETTIAAHLARRLREQGVDRGFGIVGDFALHLFGALADEGFPVDVTADEQGAGFAADAYARLRGLGLCAVTFGVGGLKVANATAGAWAEYVPLLVVSGAPGLAERADDPLLHHKVKGFDTQMKVFTDLTVAQASLDDPRTAASEIDRVLTAILVAQRPGYLEIPRDMVHVPIADVPGDLEVPGPLVDEEVLDAAVRDTLEQLEAASRAVLVGGVMVLRRGLREPLARIARATGIPVATTALARGAFPERDPLGLGVYMGAVSQPAVVEFIESADLGLAFGALYTDLTMGGFTAHVDHHRLVAAHDVDVTVGPRAYPGVPLSAYLTALADAVERRTWTFDRNVVDPVTIAIDDPAAVLTAEGIVACVDEVLDERHGLVIEPGESLFTAVEMRVPSWALSSAYYATMGYGSPAALGAGRADPGRRPVVLTGDGAFLMTALEVAAAGFHGVHPIVVVYDNAGYGTQRPMLDGPFNDIPPVAADRLPEAFGFGWGVACRTVGELREALARAVREDATAIIRAVIPRHPPSAALTRMTDALNRRR